MDENKSWDDKFSSDEYYFGKEPNEFFKQEIDKLSKGRILMIGDGEGRNSVYAAKLGWDVDSIDISIAGKQKALANLTQRNSFEDLSVLKKFQALEVPDLYLAWVLYVYWST